MWTFQISTGVITDPNGKVITDKAYSGHPPYVNDASATHLKGQGPLPCGLYRIGFAENDPHLGPCIMPLAPIDVPGIGDRGGFYLHGDNAAMNRTGSDGCIVDGHADRVRIASSLDRDLQVVP
jgi:hypothetical protein